VEYYINKAMLEAGDLDAALRMDQIKEGVEVFVKRIAEGQGPASIAADLQDLPQTRAYFQRYPGRLETTARTWTAKFHEEAKRDTMESFRDITGGAEEYSATLDSRTRPEHMELDGRVYSPNPKSGQYSSQVQPPMPNSYNCRCTYIPYLEPLDTVIRSASLRASIDGPVQGDTLYAQWFSTQGKDSKEEIVGKGRYALAQERYGRVELADIMHRSGTRFKTQGELRDGL
jgi:SPP1 gp7 family putative phage head morphogenesis protein